MTVTVIVIRICGQHPAFIKIEPSVIQRLYQANTSGGFIIHAERYDQVKIKPTESEEKYRCHLRLRRLRSFEELSES